MSGFEQFDHSGAFGGFKQSSPPADNTKSPPSSGVTPGVTPYRQQQNKDGTEPKRRGPKPSNIAPANDRVARNRTAQRTHRERKEQYIKKVEGEVNLWKEMYTSVAMDRDAAYRELTRLRELLSQHGIHVEQTVPNAEYANTMPSLAGSSVSSGHPRDSSATTLSPSPFDNLQSPRSRFTSAKRLPNIGADYDRAMEFIITLEAVCSKHMQYLVVRSQMPQHQQNHHPAERADDLEHDHMCGHSLMLTCPPLSYIMQTPEVPYPPQMINLPRFDLERMLEACCGLEVPDEELTPVMAFAAMWQDERYETMTNEEFREVMMMLSTQTHCFGFGAVVERYLVREYMNKTFEARLLIPDLEGWNNDAFAYQMNHDHLMA